MDTSNQWLVWNPEFLLHNEGSKVVIMILNQPYSENTKNYLTEKWNYAVICVTVDGGLNYINESFDTNLIPNIICGDFDSVSHELLQRYAKLGVEIIHTPDQDNTDFTKALKCVASALAKKNTNADAILVIGNSGGRVDHILGNLSTLYIANTISNIPVFLVGDNSLTWLLEPGKHKILVSKRMIDGYVGLLPLGEPCTSVTTSGLKWNLYKSTMQYGGLISICNKFDGSDHVTVANSNKLIWTTEYKL